jgi:hypothetical protein
MADPDFEARMLLAHLRWLLTDEAHSIVQRLERDGIPLGVENIAPMLMLAVRRARPRSRLVPWHLSNAVVERMIRVVTDALISEERPAA